jgi:hypothetical protein
MFPYKPDLLCSATLGEKVMVQFQFPEMRVALKTQSFRGRVREIQQKRASQNSLSKIGDFYMHDIEIEQKRGG